jgi:anti-anti-sigma factor
MALDLRREEEPGFSLFAEELGSMLSVSFRGALDLAVIDECAAALEEPLAGPEQIILLDLAELSFADSTGLRFLIDTKRRAESSGKRLILGRVSRPVLRLFEMAGLTSWFEYLDGHAPSRMPCPLCGAEMLTGSPQCPRCGAQLDGDGDGSLMGPEG